MSPAQSSTSSQPKVTSPAARATKDASNKPSTVKARGIQKRSALWRVYCLLFNIDCIMGGEMLNVVEMMIVYVVLLGFLALLGWGSYKALSKVVAAFLPLTSP